MTTAFVATLGGHISELVELSERIGWSNDDIWITNDSPQTRDLLSDRRVEMVPFIGERDRIGVLRAVRNARRILQYYRVERVVSTGSAIALAYLPVAATMSLDAHYIESSTRVESCSTTGRLLSRTPGVHCHWQTSPAPSRFNPVGGVYDRYTTIDPPTLERAGADGEIERVVVSVGTTDRCFRRMVARLVEVLPARADVLWQTGHSDVDDLDIEAHRLVSETELAVAMERADVVITHAGAGSLALALRSGHSPVFVPRRSAFDEQIDDHQVELARWAQRRGLAVHAEADQIDRVHLRTAARRLVSTKPVERLVLA